VCFRDPPPKFATSFTVGDLVLLTKKKGWNVLLYDPYELKVISQTSYDSLYPREMQHLTTFLDAVPEETIVAISLLGYRYKGFYDSRLCAAMQRLGGTGTDWDDSSFAMVGQKGWGSGRAIEAYYGRGGVVTATLASTTFYRW
jgi:hypothetical protein